MPASDARPQPLKNSAYRLYFAVRKSDGTLMTSWAGADSQISKDGGAFSECLNEATEIGSSGCGFIDLSATEMDADSVLYRLTLSNTGALPVVVSLFPAEASDFSLQQAVISPSAALSNQYSRTFDRDPNPLDCPYLAQKNFSVSVYSLSSSGEKVAVPMTGRTLRVVFEIPGGTDLVVVEDAAISKSANTFSFTNPTLASTPPGGQRQMTGRWSCREVSTNFPWAFGSWQVFDVAIKD